jgi:hypothetical protein
MFLNEKELQYTTNFQGEKYGSKEFLATKKWWDKMKESIFGGKKMKEIQKGKKVISHKKEKLQCKNCCNFSMEGRIPRCSKYVRFSYDSIKLNYTIEKIQCRYFTKGE